MVLLCVEITPKAQRLFCVVQIDLLIEWSHFLLIFVIYIKDYYSNIVAKGRIKVSKAQILRIFRVSNARIF